MNVGLLRGVAAASLAIVSLVLPLTACGHPSRPSPPAQPPPPIQSAIASNLQAGGCSATRISETYVLTAAHCAFGYDGRENRPMQLRKLAQETAEVRIVESGRFHPEQGELADWVLLEPAGGADALTGIGIASFPTIEEIAWVERVLAGASGEDQIAIWGVTFPAPTFRTYPRQAATKGQRLVSRGRLLTDLEYRQRVALVVSTGQIYDEMSGFPFPPLPAGAMAIWQEPDEGAFDRPFIVNGYWDYKRDQNPVWYHTADYSNGSSGGGFFLEKSGHYLGLVPMGQTPFERSASFAGFGNLYRIDKICAQSERLRALAGCQQLVNRRP